MSVTRVSASELNTEQVAKVLTQPLEQASLFLAAGPRIYDTVGPFRLPKQGGPITDPGWTGESEQIPERDVDFDEVEMLPSTMKSVKVITRYSNEMARSSVVALDTAIKGRLVSDVAAKLDRQFFSAGGDGTLTPQGMFAWSGTQSVSGIGAMTNLDPFADAWAKALAAHVSMASVKWVMKPREWSRVLKMYDNDGRYLIQPDPVSPSSFRLFGAPVVLTDRVPDTTGGTPTGRAALVDFSQVAVARDLAPSVKVLTERYADFDEQALRVVARYDVKPVNPEAVVVLSGITI